MRIKKIRIQNFRSIKELDVEPGSYSVLVGENNAGKSNILRALNLIMGETWPSERSFSEEDFYNKDISQEIVIQVFFDEEIEEFHNNAKAVIAGFCLSCRPYKRRTGKKAAGSLNVSYVCIDRDGKTVKTPSVPLQKGVKPTGAWLDLRVSGDLRERIPFIYVDVLREYDRQTPGSRWSVLRKLFNEVNTEFLNSKDQINVKLPDGSLTKMSRKDAFEHAVKDAYQFLRTQKFEEIEKALAANVLEQMGIAAGEGDVGLHFTSHDPTNAYKSLQLYVEQLGITSPAGEVGAGLQSAIVVGIFRTYEQLKKEGAVFAIEEPEVFLHPQKARYFETVLQAIAERGNQVILTTHSPVFVRVHQPESVVIVRRTAERGTWATQTELVDIAEDDRKALRLMTEFDAQRNELFFARKVMLVEGATEKVALPLVFRSLGHDINQLGISVVECGGKTSISLFVKVATALGIPFVVLADHDIREIPADASDKKKAKLHDDNQKHKQWNQTLETLCPAGQLFWLKPKFEAELGLPTSESEKVRQALEKFSSISKEEIPTCLTEPVNALLQL